MRLCGLFLFSLLLLSTLLIGQGPSPRPSFQVAEIQPSTTKSVVTYMRGGVIRGGRLQVRTASLLDLIEHAYNVPANAIVGGPSWLGSERFDIVAGAGPDTTQEDARLMMRSLLEERFGLVVQKETRPQPAFVLTAGKGKHRMRPSANGAGGCEGATPVAPGAIVGSFNEVQCRNVTMAVLAEQLPGLAGALYLPNPVVDETGLTGAWDFSLRWNPRNQLAAAGGEGRTIFDAIEQQLGLKLEPAQRPREVTVVVNANRNPTPNAPDVAAKLPPRPPESFEVAIVKRSLPDRPARGMVEKGRVDAEGIPLRDLILIAWDLNGPQFVVGMPPFADTTYSITAVAPIPEGATSVQDVDEDTLLHMLRTLMIERFQMQARMEERPVEGYVMTASRPKLVKADPADRSECTEGPGKDGKDPRNTNPVMNRLMTCTNMTVAQFAEQLPIRVNGYVRTAVLDSTGIEGSYDFTVSFSGVNLVRQAQAAQQPGMPPDPNGALSFPDAMEKQLGIKLELVKRPMQVLVIDSISEQPIEN